ncbi:ATP-grasp fold amidoligase family protein [Derxia lacustris]|uniref:ATP-grasp fold amidoligase family protein n=1 Tax=Derxia lacustris TaxID=764842 RepID=UPI000A16CC99|nr:ATP-grasp fold amidoligase family protein [Derxia lacustris]
MQATAHTPPQNLVPVRSAWPKRIARSLYWQLLGLLPDRPYLALRYRLRFGQWPNYRKPAHFNEFTHAYMLRARDPRMRTIADKYLVRGFIAERVGERYLVPLLGVWDCPAAIPLERLPRPLVLKDTLGSGRNIVIRNACPEAIRRARIALADWQHAPYWHREREWAYAGGRSRVIAEPLLDDGVHEFPDDFKLYLIGGELQFIQVDRDRFGNHTRNLYSPDWQLLPVRMTKPQRPADARPAALAEMIEVARRLAEGFEFLRVDFYALGGRLLIGELTNYSGAGWERFDPPEFALRLGDRWRAAQAAGRSPGA